jgi:hypothetical protein
VGWIQRKRFLVVGQGVFRNETMSFLSVGETAVLEERRGDRGGARDAWSRGEEGAGQRHGQATKIKTLVQTIHPGIRGTLSVGVPRVLWGEWPSAAQTTTESLQRNGEEEAYGLATGKTDSEQMPEPGNERELAGQNVAYRDPHFEATDGMTYIADKGAETRASDWPIWNRLGSLAAGAGRG